jgi:prepilin-type N-terminal cleavage/methylation domain-containing protein
MERKRGFTLIELMVVILIVSILAGVAIPLMQGRIDSAKWSEANATAGTIRTAVRAYYAEHGTAPTGELNAGTTMTDLGFDTADLTGTYFSAANYSITSVTNGLAVVNVDSTGVTGLTGSYTLGSDGTWSKD